MLAEVAATTSDTDSTHPESVAEAVEGRAAARAREANAAGIGSFRTYRRRRPASYCPLRSGPARLRMRRVRRQNLAAATPLAAVSSLCSAATRRPAIQLRARNRAMSITTLNMALAALAALSLLTCSTTRVKLNRASVGTDKDVKS